MELVEWSLVVVISLTQLVHFFWIKRLQDEFAAYRKWNLGLWEAQNKFDSSMVKSLEDLTKSQAKAQPLMDFESEMARESVQHQHPATVQVPPEQLELPLDSEPRH